MDVNYSFFLSIGFIVLGFAAKKIGIFSEEDKRTFVKIIFNFTLPAVILRTITSVELDPTLFFLPIIPFVYSLIILAFTFVLIRSSARETKGTILMTVAGFNIGNFVTYPIVESIWGLEGLKYIVMFDAGNAFVIFFICYSLGVYYASGNSFQEKPKATVLLDILKRISTAGPNSLA